MFSRNSEANGSEFLEEMIPWCHTHNDECNMCKFITMATKSMLPVSIGFIYVLFSLQRKAFHIKTVIKLLESTKISDNIFFY